MTRVVRWKLSRENCALRETEFAPFARNGTPGPASKIVVGFRLEFRRLTEFAKTAAPIARRELTSRKSGRLRKSKERLRGVIAE